MSKLLAPANRSTAPPPVAVRTLLPSNAAGPGAVGQSSGPANITSALEIAEPIPPIDDSLLSDGNMPRSVCNKQKEDETKVRFRLLHNLAIQQTVSIDRLLELFKFETSRTYREKLLIANTAYIDNSLMVKYSRKKAIEEDNKIVAPTKNVQNKIAFIFNNLCQFNLQTKCDEIKNIITDECLPWFSNYLVTKRVSSESNYHTLYSNLLDCLENEALNSLVTLETITNIRVLLKCDKGKVNSSFKPSLNNLGHWLGMITLAKNKPILLDDIKLELLLVEAYNRGDKELLFTVPFVARVLESCAKSKVFKPKNPWTMSIMNCLSELYQEPGLKLTLKFEIEILCKTLNIELTDLKPGYVLRKPEITQKKVPQTI